MTSNANQARSDNDEEKTEPFALSAGQLETGCPKGKLQTSPLGGSTLVDGSEPRTLLCSAVKRALQAEGKDSDDQLDTDGTRPLFEKSKADGDVSYVQDHRSNFSQERSENRTSLGDDQSEMREACYDQTRDKDDDSNITEFKQTEIQSGPPTDTSQDAVCRSRGDDQADAVQSGTTSLCEQGDEQVYRQDIPVVPVGVPIIYRALECPRGFWCLDYKKVTRDLMRAAGAKLPYQKILKSGFLSITSPSPEAAKTLLRLKTIAGTAVDARIPNWYARNVGKISGVPFRYTDSQLLECFSDAGVVHVRRQASYTRMMDGTTQVSPEDCIVLTFRPDIDMPNTISLGFDDFTVYAYFAPPVQCYNCFRFLHAAHQCRSSRRCKVCAGPHSYKDCTHREQPRCANCYGPHTATFSGCPAKREAAIARRFGNLYYQDWETSNLPSHSPDRRRTSSSDVEEDKVRHESGKEDACSSSRGESRKRRYGNESSSSAEQRSTDDDVKNDANLRRYDDCSGDRDITDDGEDAATQARKIPPPGQYRSFNFFKYQKCSKDSKRRYKHGYNRYLHRLQKIGVPVFRGRYNN